MTYQNRFLGGLILSGLLFFASCSDNNPTSITKEPPQIPPVESMKMDASIFQTGPGFNVEANSADSSHFRAAFLRAAFVKLIIDLQLIYPRVLLKLASEVEPELNEDGKWEWSFSSTHQGETFGVRLVAVKKDQGIYWAFYLTNSILKIENELYFEGISQNNGKRGTWTYYNTFSLGKNSKNEAVSKLVWDISGENNVSLTLTLLSDLALTGNTGDTIDYTFDGTVKRLVITRVETGKTIIIAWNVNTKAGYIIAPNYNGGMKSCWDSNFQNAQCPVL